MSYNGPHYFGPPYFGPVFFGTGAGTVTTPVDVVSWGDILQAIRVKALASDFATAFGVRMFISQAPPGAELPYAVMVPVDTVPFSTFSVDGGRLRLQVSLYAADGSGSIILAKYATYLRKNLSRAPLTVTGFEVLGVDYDIERGPFRDGDRWRYDADYIVRFQETA